MKDDMAFEAIISNTVEKPENSPKCEKPQKPYFLKDDPVEISRRKVTAPSVDAGRNDETNCPESVEIKVETAAGAGERIADSREGGIIDGYNLKSGAEQKDHDNQKKALLNMISALNSEYFKLTKIQFGILRENVALQYRICKIDMEYSSEFDEFVAGLIGKKSAPFERKRQEKEREYEAIEEKLKKIDGRIGELRAKLEEMKNAV